MRWQALARVGILLGALAPSADSVAAHIHRDRGGGLQSLCGLQVGFAACVQTPRGAVLSADPEEVADKHPIVVEAEANFKRLFGRDAPSYAVVLGELTSAQRSAILASGTSVLLPWKTRKVRDQQREAAFRNMVEQIARQRNYNEAEKAAEMQHMMNQLGAGRSGASDDAQVVPHELGHLWLISAFWPAVEVHDAGRYGAPGPDWLDEAAGIALESAAAAESRRAAFRRAYTGGAKERLERLQTLLTGDHPLHKGPPPGLVPGGAGSFIMQVSRRAGGSDAGGNIALFYEQTRVFIDFLTAASSKQDILGRIAAGIAKEGAFEPWLHKHGSANGLPANLNSLEAAWRSWLTRTYGT